MPSFYPKDAYAQDRQLKVQRLVIPLKVTHSASSSSVVLSCDEPQIMFMQSQGVNQIASQDASASFSNSPLDSSGSFNILIKVGEVVAKVMQCRMRNRVSGAEYAAHEDAGGVEGVSPNGNIMLACPSSVNFSSTDLDACLEVEYCVADGN